VSFTPLTHPLNVGPAVEVVLVLRPAQPAALTLRLAGFAALRLETKLLMPPVAALRHKQLFAMQTLTAIAFWHDIILNQSQEKKSPAVPIRHRTRKKTDRNNRRKAWSEVVPKKTDQEEDGDS
jgi:hypothetical protein